MENRVKLIYEAVSELAPLIADLSKILELNQQIASNLKSSNENYSANALAQKQALADIAIQKSKAIEDEKLFNKLLEISAKEKVSIEQIRAKETAELLKIEAKMKADIATSSAKEDLAILRKWAFDESEIVKDNSKQQIELAKIKAKEESAIAVMNAKALIDIEKQKSKDESEIAKTNAKEQLEIAKQKSREQAEAIKSGKQLELDAVKLSTQQQKTANQQAQDSYKALGDTLTGVARLVMTVFSINQAKSFINDIIDAKSKVDNFKNTLLSMGDSVSAVNSVSNAIQKLDERSAFTSEQLIRTATALKANSVPTQDLVEKLTMLGTVSALVGEQKLPLIAKAYLDVRNKQVLMAQETRQFIENGVPLYDLLAKSMDKPKQAVIDMAKAHEISFADVEKALKESTEKGGIYYGALENKAKSLQGQVSNLSASFFYGQKNLADYFEGTLQKGIGIIRDFIDASLGSDKAIGRTIDYVKSATAIWLSYKVAQLAVNASLKANNADSAIELLSIQSANIKRKETIALKIIEITESTALSTAKKAELIQTLQNTSAQIADNGVKTIGVGITASLRSAVSGLWLALSANPIGFVLSALSLLISGFYTYKALTVETIQAQNQEIEGLNKLKVGFQTQLQAIANTTAGSEARRKEVTKMQALYPEYLSKINLETAGINDLHKALDLANIQFERKIRLASANAQIDIVSKKALDIENERYQIIAKLRETYKDLSNQYLKDSNFISALNTKVLKEQIEIRGEYGELITTTDKATKGFLKNYADLGTQSRDTYKEIERVSLNASKLSIQYQKEDYDNLKKQLKNKEITVAEYNKAILALDNARRKETETSETETETKINKNRAEQRIFTANEIKVKELLLAKDTFENRKLLLEYELKVDIERANKRYKGEKDAKEKSDKEIRDLVKQYNLDLADLQDDHDRYLERKRTENYADIKKDADQSFVDLAKLDEKYLEKIEKQKTAHEQKVEKLNDDIDEARVKKANALLILDEISSAKTAQEKYDVILKYGKRTSDELTALNLEQWKKDEKAQTVFVKFLSESGEGYKKMHQEELEKLLELRKKILNAETTVITKTSEEQLALIKKNEEFKRQMISDTFKMMSDTFDKMSKVTKDFLDYSVDANRRAYERQYNLLEGNTEARIKLTQDYAKKEEELLISNARLQKFASFLTSLSKAFGEYYDKQTKAHEQYQARVQEIDNMGLDATKANNLKSIASSQEKLSKISSAVQSGLSLVGDYMTTSYNLEMQQLDAQLKNIRAYYEEKITLAGESKDATIKALDDEEKAKLATLEKQKQAEIDSVNEAKDKGIITTEEASKKIIEIETRYAVISKDITDKTTTDKANAEKTYVDDVAKLKAEQAQKEDEIERQKFEAQKEMMTAQILMSGLMAEAALLPYYIGPTLPYAIAAAVAIGVATGAMIAKVSKMQYKSSSSAYSPIGWQVNTPAPAGSGGDLSTPTPEIPITTNQAPYGGQVASAPNTKGSDGHEMPIENLYDNNGNYLYSIYGYEDKVVGDGNGGTMTIQMPRTTPNFFKGSDYVERGMNLSGIDKIPAMINEGERIIPTSQNEELGGRDLSNTDLVKYTKIGKIVSQRIPNIVDMMVNSGVNYKLNYDITPSKANNDELISEVRKIVEAVKEKETPRTSINIDQYNVTVDEQYNNLRVKYKNQQFSRK